MHPHRQRTDAWPSALARTAAALVVSVALNAAGLAGLVAWDAMELPSHEDAARVALAPVTGAAWEANRRVARAPSPPVAAAGPPADAAPTPPPRPAEPLGQVVDVAPSQDLRRPEHARFLAERDGRVERETRSRDTGHGQWATAAPKPTAGEKGRAGIADSGAEGKGEDSEPGKVGAPAAATETSTPTPTPTPTPTAPPAAASTAPPTSAPSPGVVPIPGSTVSAARAMLARADGEGGARRAGAWDPRLLPTGAQLGSIAAGGPSESVPRSVPEGDETRLNTRRFRFAEFYARVHAAIRREWDPNRAWNARDPHDRILGRRTRNARFDILLEPDGRIRDVRLVDTSGFEFLDRECERAIRSAAPFPNPPAGLVGGDGVVALRGWVLSFEFGPRGALDALRR
jgi:TonB family protein